MVLVSAARFIYLTNFISPPPTIGSIHLNLWTHPSFDRQACTFQSDLVEFILALPLKHIKIRGLLCL